MKTSSCKAKGRELQKYVARKIRETFALPEEDVVSRPMGSPGADIMLSAAALRLLPLSIECKNTKSQPSLAALAQATLNAKNGQTPLVVWKPPGKGYENSIVYLNLQSFLSLLMLNQAQLNVVTNDAKIKQAKVIDYDDA
jgi:hypothetical protein